MIWSVWKTGNPGHRQLTSRTNQSLYFIIIFPIWLIVIRQRTKMIIDKSVSQCECYQ